VIGSLVHSRRLRKGCSSTGGREISDEALYEGYLVSREGKVVGEARRYDPYSGFGDIMLYEIDLFGFVPGFVSKGIKLMSEEDLRADPRLRKEFEESQYQVWKRRNVVHLIKEFNSIFKNSESFEKYCRNIYRGMEKQN
jgi:hypothetical protein